MNDGTSIITSYMYRGAEEFYVECYGRIDTGYEAIEFLILISGKATAINKSRK